MRTSPGTSRSVQAPSRTGRATAARAARRSPPGRWTRGSRCRVTYSVPSAANSRTRSLRVLIRTSGGPAARSRGPRAAAAAVGRVEPVLDEISFIQATCWAFGLAGSSTPSLSAMSRVFWSSPCTRRRIFRPASLTAWVVPCCCTCCPVDISQRSRTLTMDRGPPRADPTGGDDPGHSGHAGSPGLPVSRRRRGSPPRRRRDSNCGTYGVAWQPFGECLGSEPGVWVKQRRSGELLRHVELFGVDAVLGHTQGGERLERVVDQPGWAAEEVVELGGSCSPPRTAASIPTLISPVAPSQPGWGRRSTSVTSKSRSSRSQPSSSRNSRSSWLRATTTSRCGRGRGGRPRHAHHRGDADAAGDHDDALDGGDVAGERAVRAVDPDRLAGLEPVDAPVKSPALRIVNSTRPGRCGDEAIVNGCSSAVTDRVSRSQANWPGRSPSCRRSRRCGRRG